MLPVGFSSFVSFLGGSMDTNTEECSRAKDGAKIRFNQLTNEYGVLSRNGRILTYYKASIAWHGHPTNYDYFRWDCSQI